MSVAAYLTIKFNAAFKNQARSVNDAIKFGVAVYHGMYNSIRNTQIKLKNDQDWAPIEKELRASGDKVTIDKLDYIYKVIK